MDAKPHPSCLAAIHLPHRICLEQIFHVKQGKGSRRVNFKSLILRAFSPSPPLS